MDLAGPQEVGALERSFRSGIHLGDSAERNEGCGHGQKRQEGRRPDGLREEESGSSQDLGPKAHESSSEQRWMEF